MATIRLQRTGQGHERRILLLFEDEPSLTSLVKTLPGVMWDSFMKGWLVEIRNAKGYKDRYVQLSAYLLLLLKDYCKEFRPKEFLFEGQNGTPFYSGESIDKIMTYLKTVPEGWVSHPKWRYIPTFIMKITLPGWVSKTLCAMQKKPTHIQAHLVFADTQSQR